MCLRPLIQKETLAKALLNAMPYTLFRSWHLGTSKFARLSLQGVGANSELSLMFILAPSLATSARDVPFFPDHPNEKLFIRYWNAGAPVPFTRLCLHWPQGSSPHCCYSKAADGHSQNTSLFQGTLRMQFYLILTYFPMFLQLKLWF